MTKRYVFRTDAARQVGFGHLRRSLTLARVISARGNLVSFLLSDLSESLAIQQVAALSFRIDHIGGGGSLGSEIDALQNNLVPTCDFIVADIAHTPALAERHLLPDYLRQLHRYAGQLIVVEGLGGDSIAKECDGIADLIVTPYAFDPSATTLATRSQHLIGAQYAILDQAYAKIDLDERPTSPQGSKILITTGGSDPTAVVLRILAACERLESRQLELRVIVGPMFSRHLKQSISDFAEQSAHGVTLIKAPEELLPQMLWCDLAISTSGLTKYELAASGTPAILLSHDAAHAINNGAFAALGISVDLGEADKLSDASIAAAISEVLESGERRADMFKRGRQEIDGAGARRVADAMEGLAA